MSCVRVTNILCISCLHVPDGSLKWLSYLILVAYAYLPVLFTLLAGTGLKLTAFPGGWHLCQEPSVASHTALPRVWFTEAKTFATNKRFDLRIEKHKEGKKEGRKRKKEGGKEGEEE